MLAKIKKNRATTSFLRRFAEVNELVKFGKLNSDDHIERLRGATFSLDSQDSNYMHGNVAGYETTFFTRSSTHKSLEHGQGEYNWTVLSIELQLSGLPHVIFDNKRHDKRFYNSVFTRNPKLRRGKQLLSNLNYSAATNFDLYIAPETAYDFANIFSDEILQRMTYHYGKFDIEVQNDRLFVFTRGLPQSYKQLKEMLDEALWLAERLEMRASYQPAEPNRQPLNFVPA